MECLHRIYDQSQIPIMSAILRGNKMGTRLVIGNGFDLSAQAKTSYSEFFDSEFYRTTRNSAEKWIDLVEIDIIHKSNMMDYKFKFNCWDLFFCIWGKIYSEKASDAKWCDIEREIYDSLIDSKKTRWFYWDRIYSALNDYYTYPSRYDLICKSLRKSNESIVFYYISQMNWKENCKSKSGFYERLLNELKAFERRFGEYIDKETSSDEYNEKAIRQLNLLSDDDAVQIDSFNYSSFTARGVSMRHINGDCKNPIFGINLTKDELEMYPEVRCFTKTSRRVQQDAHHIKTYSSDYNVTVDSAIVYGHSLNKMDYDYFNYLFTLLKFNTFDVEKMGSVEFVYRIYDPDRANEIRNNYADAIYDVLNYYEGYVSKTNQNILINLLRFSGKLTIREL